MRRVTLGALGPGQFGIVKSDVLGRLDNIEARLSRIEVALRTIETASYEENIIDIGSSFELTGTVTESYSIDAGAATLAELRNYVASLIKVFQRGGRRRTT